MGTRNARQCKDRWEKFLSPSINQRPFSDDEDYIILMMLEKFGPRWVKITQCLPGRSDVSVRAMYRFLCRHNVSLQQVTNMVDKSQIKSVNKIIDENSRQRHIVEQKTDEIDNIFDQDFDDIFSDFLIST